jgi:D-3-phosphoglycerate dehydrogenase / 2-oxoglutarate reductase
MRKSSRGDVVPDAVVESLILDLLEWIGPKPRPYTEVLDAWRTSCPRLPVWEEVNERGFVTTQVDAVQRRLISLSPAGREHLAQYRAQSLGVA